MCLRSIWCEFILSQVNIITNVAKLITQFNVANNIKKRLLKI